MVVADIAALTTLTGCMKGNSAALQEVWNRIEGKVKSEVDMQVGGDGLIGLMKQWLDGGKR